MQKTIRRTAALAAAAVMLCSVPCTFAAEGDELFRDGFESGESGWKGRGGASAEATSASAYAGSKALAVTGRSDSWNGAEKDISAVCRAGESYAFSVCVSSSASVTFMLSLDYKDAGGEHIYAHLAEAETAPGFFVQLYTPEFRIPAGATDPLLYVETKSGTASFTLDEAVCAPAGTVIEGPAPRVFTLGDCDYDGSITAADFTLAALFARDGAKDKAADVDKSGKVDSADVSWIAQFLKGEVSEYPEPVAPPKSDFPYNANLQYRSFDEREYLSRASHPGQVIEEHYQGPKGTNTCYVYLPPDYDENAQYNVFYLMHGGNENEKTLFHQDDTMIQNILDHMIEKGELEPLIVVTPTWSQTGAHLFYSEFRERLVPYIETKYATYAASGSEEDLQASRYHRAYGGFSMGSVSTWGVLMHELDICAYYMPLSGEYKVDNLSNDTQTKMITDAIKASGLTPREYFIMGATGTNDMAQPGMTPLMRALMTHTDLFTVTSDLSQGNFYYMLVDGKEHWWGHVRHYIYDMLPYFFHEGT